jgi:hypothetical protein
MHLRAIPRFVVSALAGERRKSAQACAAITTENA